MADPKIRFIHLITRSGKSMSQIARDSGLSLAHLSKVTNGVRMPSLGAINLLVEAMGIPAQDIIDAINAGWHHDAACAEDKRIADSFAKSNKKRKEAKNGKAA